MKHAVLILDDSLTVRMDLSDVFTSAGFAVVACATMAEARAAIASRRFSLFVLDVLLPDGDGIDLLRELRNAPATADVPVILLSTEAEVRNRVRGLRTGADDYVGKPYEAAHVLGRARQLLRATETPEPAGSSLLLIDDSATFRNAFKAVLESRGYTVVTAVSGEEGLRAAVAAHPSGIIVDGNLAGELDGATVIRRLKQDLAFRDTPCLLLTASETAGDELRTLEAGADAYVRKAEDLDVILARIVALLRSAASAAPAGFVSSLLGPKRILTVDDSVTYLHELADELRKEGYDVILAASGSEALDLLEVQPADCILLDLVMPGLSGQETCRRIKKRAEWRSIPLVILTAVEEPGKVIEGFNAGADDYIPKSCDFDVLKARVRAQLRRKQFEDEYRSIQERLRENEIEMAHAEAAREIAEARAAIQPLLRNEAWLNTVTRMAHLGGWDWQIAEDVVTWSDEQYRIFGLDPQTRRATPQTFVEAIHPEDRERVVQAMNNSLGSEKKFQVECRIVQPGGGIRHVMCLGEVCEEKDARPMRMVGTVLDLTDRRRAEAALEERAVELARINAELRQFAYAASHDLQEPLRTIASFTELLAQRYRGKLDTQADEFITFVVEGAVRMQALIEGLLAYSRVNTRAVPLALTSCESILKDALANLRKAVQECGAEVTHDPLPSVNADPAQLCQVFQNLIGNALKFHGPQPPKVHVSVQRCEGGWRFSIQDNGIGIDPAFAEQVFVIFRRLHPVSEYPGTGMGLAICKKIVERHGGRIWLESAPGQGSTFYFTIPAGGAA